MKGKSFDSGCGWYSGKRKENQFQLRGYYIIDKILEVPPEVNFLEVSLCKMTVG
jgi:hypothetical protein